MEKQEFNKLKSEDEKTIEILGFVDLKEIDPVSGQGQVKIGTEVWSAKTLNDKNILINKLQQDKDAFDLIIKEKDTNLF